MTPGMVPLSRVCWTTKLPERSLSRPTCGGSVPESGEPAIPKLPVSLRSCPACVGRVPLSRWLYGRMKLLVSEVSPKSSVGSVPTRLLPVVFRRGRLA